MIHHMNQNIEKLVDFAKLRRCNSLCWKWGERFGINQNDFSGFIVHLPKKINEYKVKLDVRYRSQFVKDAKIMFYAAEVEEILVKQYSAMIFSIMRRLRLPHEEFEEFETDGMMAIRSSAWLYRNIKGANASFTTYCYNAIMLRIRGVRHKIYEKRLRREGMATIKSESDFGEKFNFNQFAKDYSKNNEEIDLDQQIDGILEFCKLNEQEIFLVKSFVNRYQGDINNKTNGHWYDAFQQKYLNPRLKKGFSRQGIYNQLVKVQQKILYCLKKADRVSQDYQLALSTKALIRSN